jgi:hypothetical protein
MKFYQKHIPDGQNIQAIIHQHWLVVFDKYLLWLSFWALIPSFLYYQSERVRDLIPFFVLEILLFLVFWKIIYELYNWYNDVWIVTEQAIYDLEWSLLKTNVQSIHLESIEGLEVDKHRIWDAIFNKWDIIIHKFWEEEIAIYSAYAPHRAITIIEEYINPPEDEEEDNNFDLVMDTLSWVVKDYLQNNWLPDHINTRIKHQHQSDEKYDEESEIVDDKDSAYTLDLR